MSPKQKIPLSQLTPGDIANRLGISEVDLWARARSVDACFKPTVRRMFRGKVRDLDRPDGGHKIWMRKLHRFLQSNYRPHRAVHGGCKRRSCFTAAHLHKGGKAVLLIRDIANCYPSIHTAQLIDGLARYGFRAETAELIGLLMTPRGRVAQGSPLSADALNYYLYPLDEVLYAACRENGFRYTRTYDDIVVSGDNHAIGIALGRMIEREIGRLGLTVNEKKKLKNGRQTNRKEQRVHNLVVNSRLGIALPDEHAKEALREAMAYANGAVSARPDSLVGLACRRQVAGGHLNYCRQADFAPVTVVKKLIGQGDQTVRDRLKKEGVTKRKKWWKPGRKDAVIKELADRWRTVRSRTLRPDATTAI